MPTDPSDVDWYLDNVVVPSGIERRKVGPVLAWQGGWTALANQLHEDADASPTGNAIRLALGQGFVLSRAQVRASGMADAALRRLLRRGDWSSCGHGSVAIIPACAPATASRSHGERRRRHALKCAGAAQRRRHHVVGGASAAILHGLPVLDVPDLPGLVATATTSGRRAAAHVRLAGLQPDEVDDWFGIAATTPERTVADVARFDPRSGLMAADAGLREGVVSRPELDRIVGRCAGHFGVRRAREVLALASAMIESPLESLTHLALHESGFPSPVLQHSVRGFDGKTYRVDFAWPNMRLALEADGRSKYTADALWREKKREVALTRVGWRIARVTWADILDGWAGASRWLRELMASDPPR